jgi:hypothetical protein
VTAVVLPCGTQVVFINNDSSFLSRGLLMLLLVSHVALFSHGLLLHIFALSSPRLFRCFGCPLSDRLSDLVAEQCHNTRVMVPSCSNVYMYRYNIEMAMSGLTSN